MHVTEENGAQREAAVEKEGFLYLTERDVTLHERIKKRANFVEDSKAIASCLGSQKYKYSGKNSRQGL